MTAKVVPFNGVTRHNLPADRVLEAALEVGLDDVVILGYDKERFEYFASSLADGGDVLWLLERFKLQLLNIGSEED